MVVWVSMSRRNRNHSLDTISFYPASHYLSWILARVNDDPGATKQVQWGNVSARSFLKEAAHRNVQLVRSKGECHADTASLGAHDTAERSRIAGSFAGCVENLQYAHKWKALVL